MTDPRLDRAKNLREEAEGLLASDEEEERKEGFELLAEAVAELDSIREELEGRYPIGGTKNPSEEDAKQAAELAESYGIAGGAYRRAGNLEKAISFYERGATMEERLALSSTYNLMNVVKWSLRLGRKTLEELESRLKLLQKGLEADVDEISGNRRRDAWAFADLGDCRALLGDELGALEAYRRFIDLGGTDDPRSTLTVLEAIIGNLDEGTSARKAVQAGIDLLRNPTR